MLGVPIIMLQGQNIMKARNRESMAWSWIILFIDFQFMKFIFQLSLIIYRYITNIYV